MGLFDKLFGSRNKSSAIDLTKPYRDLLAEQTAPVVRGVILHAIVSMDELQTFDSTERTLLGETFIDEIKKKMATARQQQAAYAPSDAAISAITQAVSFILIKSAGKTFYGEDTVIRNCSGPGEVKKAAMCFAFGLLIFMPLLTAFMQAGVVSSTDRALTSGEWKADLLSCFMLASREQKAEIIRLGSKMFHDLKGRQESNVIEFLETLEQLTMLTAMNWEGKKTPEEVMLGMFKQKVDVLLGALE